MVARASASRFRTSIRSSVRLSDSLIAGDPVRLSGFGNFELRDKNERPGRNPKTGEEVPVSARRVVTFRAGQKLRARVEIYHPLDDE